MKDNFQALELAINTAPAINDYTASAAPIADKARFVVYIHGPMGEQPVTLTLWRNAKVDWALALIRATITQATTKA